mmetsp:Transcript_18705/g.53233  ORF Transcript_18705/g.53233 Transcript_18705/m.53233 type:complete len:240 (+) Transcript_18705:778-1497(+)
MVRATTLTDALRGGPCQTHIPTALRGLATGCACSGRHAELMRLHARRALERRRSAHTAVPPTGRGSSHTHAATGRVLPWTPASPCRRRHAASGRTGTRRRRCTPPAWLRRGKPCTCPPRARRCRLMATRMFHCSRTGSRDPWIQTRRGSPRPRCSRPNPACCRTGSRGRDLLPDHHLAPTSSGRPKSRPLRGRRPSRLGRTCQPNGGVGELRPSCPSRHRRHSPPDRRLGLPVRRRPPS